MMGRKRRPFSHLGPNDSNASRKKTKVNDSSTHETESSERRAGTLLRIVLKNFMCHSLLDVDLSSPINIIIGKNGSGKSAILTALIVGLGGKASLTHRGNSVKGFIKAGKQSGTVEIHINNVGVMAYRPKIYGRKITVVRHFTASGSSLYRVKSESGQVIATQVREINNIVTSLNIQVNNPICILNQDTSRNFLSSNDPKHKFALFMKATKLETLEEQYKKVKENKLRATRLWQEKNQIFEKMREEYSVLEEKMRDHRSIVQIKKKVMEAHNEVMWSKVKDHEELSRKEEKAVREVEKKRDKVLEERDSRAERIDNIKSNINCLNQQISELKQTIKIQSAPRMDVKKIIEDLRIKYNEKKREKNNINMIIDRKTKDAAVLEDEISKANENMSRVEQEKMQRLRDLTAMNEKIKGMDDHLQTLRNDLYQITSDVSIKEEEKQALRQEIYKIDQQISNDRNSLNALKNESDNTLLLYGRDMPTIKNLIEQNRHKFQQVPIGPMGSYIKLKDKKWALAVETHVDAGFLGSFTVDNAKDSALLQNIFKQACTGRKPTVITSKFFFQKHDVTSNLVQAPDDCVRLYDAIEVEEPVVCNCLIDQLSIERILLIPDNERAIQLMSNRQNVPRNCQEGITMKGDKFYPDPNYKTYGSRNDRPRFLQVDTKEHILQVEQNMKSLIQKKENVQNQFKVLNREINEQSSTKTELETKINRLNAAKTQVRRQLEQLKATVEPEVANVDLLESELNEIRNVLRDKQAGLSRVDEALKEIKSAVTENEAKSRQLQEANSSLEERLAGLESQVREESTKQKEISTSDEFDRNRLQRLEQDVVNARNKLADSESVLQQLTEQAARLGQRPENLRKVPDIMAEIAALERNVRRIEVDTENHEVIKDRYLQLQEKIGVTMDLMNSIQEDIVEVTTAAKRRSKHCEVTKNYFVYLIKKDFSNFLKSRNFEGTMEINILEQELDLKVIPQQGSHDVTTTSNLSGGERSFSTVGFLHSLWQCMDFPFYFLDEFDVFMDKLNRSMVFEILLQHAENHKDLQFIFMTPQDVSFVKKNVSILKLADPDRMTV